MGQLGYVIVFCVFLFAMLAGAYVCLAVYAPKKQKQENGKQKKGASVEVVKQDDVLIETQEVPETEESCLEVADEVNDTDEAEQEETLEKEEEDTPEPSLLSKIDKSASLTDTICDCDGLDEKAYIKDKLHKQDAKFTNRTRKKE